MKMLPAPLDSGAKFELLVWVGCFFTSRSVSDYKPFICEDLIANAWTRTDISPFPSFLLFSLSSFPYSLRPSLIYPSPLPSPFTLLSPSPLLLFLALSACNSYLVTVSTHSLNYQPTSTLEMILSDSTPSGQLYH